MYVQPSLTFRYLTFCPHSVLVFYEFQNEQEFFTVQLQTTGFYNRDGVCLLRGTNWALK
jgi:hypothetical protein